MKNKILLGIRLDLFDGGASAGGAAGAGTGAAAPAQGGTSTQGGTQSAVPGNTRRGKSGEYDNVLFGKQAAPATAGGNPATDGGQAPSSDAGSDKNKPGVSVTSDTLEERRKAYQDFVNGDFKDIHTQEIQRVIDRRFKETRNLEQQVSSYQPLIDMLAQRYKISDGDIGKLMSAIESDNALWEQAADEAGMSVEQYKQFQQLQRKYDSLLHQQEQRQGRERAQRQVQVWTAQAEQVKAAYPSFDLAAETQNPRFMAMLKSGVPMQAAYEVVHMEEIKAGVARVTAQAAEKQIVDGIRARGTRPKENGTASQSGFTVKDDVSKLTKKDRAEIVRRAARGEHIEF